MDITKYAADYAARTVLQPVAPPEIDRFCQVGRHAECMAGVCDCACHRADPFPTPEAVDAFLTRNGIDPERIGRRASIVARNLWEWQKEHGL